MKGSIECLPPGFELHVIARIAARYLFSRLWHGHDENGRLRVQYCST